MDKIYKKLMQKCFDISLLSKGENMPNPYVGAIVYDEDKNEIISSGYHKKYGQAHAEVNAIENAKGNTKNKTLIVNLEPCSHYGKTPPCADLIIKSGFKKVIAAMYDVNPEVRTNGIKKLQNAGIQVEVGILEEKAKDLNKVFIKNMTEKKPYLMLKTATTLDSKIANLNKESKWITNKKSRAFVQKLRNEYCAIMTASGTVLKDNPRLNVRIKNGKNPIRIIFDPNNKLDFENLWKNYNVFNNDNTRIILINNSKIKTPNYIEKIEFDGNFDELFKNLYKKNIYSIMTEAGQGFNSLLFKNKEIDEINHFIAPKIFGSGLDFVEGIECLDINSCIKLEKIKIKKFFDNGYEDILINAKVAKT